VKEWLTVAEAALLVGRAPRNIYRWIEKGTLRSRTSADGTLEVKSEDARRVESVTMRGRPRGSAGRR
jgi:predicted site-specific integrase-resolvase